MPLRLDPVMAVRSVGEKKTKWWREKRTDRGKVNGNLTGVKITIVTMIECKI